MLDFEETAKLHYRKVYSFALHLTRNNAEAEDLTQHAFYRLAINLNKLKSDKNIKGWLYSTLYRRFIDQQRRIVKFPTVDFIESDAPQTTESPLTKHQIDHDAVKDALLDLEESLRVPLSLFYLEDYSYKEIAALLEMPIGTVMSRLYRGKSELYKRLLGSKETGSKIENLGGKGKNA